MVHKTSKDNTLKYQTYVSFITIRNHKYTHVCNVINSSTPMNMVPNLDIKVMLVINPLIDGSSMNLVSL